MRHGTFAREETARGGKPPSEEKGEEKFEIVLHKPSRRGSLSRRFLVGKIQGRLSGKRMFVKFRRYLTELIGKKFFAA
jgi:hypothetical protein